MDNSELIAAQIAASKAYSAGNRLAERTDKLDRIDPDKLADQDIGRLLSNPAAFWAMAVTKEACGNGELAGALALSNQVASAQMAVGDVTFVRDSLIGQAQWLGVVAIKMMTRAEGQKNSHISAQSIKLALTAQRQAAQCLINAAALDKQRV
ncbi:hypothetical protein [Glaciimonas immobilis]|uniref:Uncharacterized protein n=1 Tax=Glaciimonas immobilis TaxID=728004 RepID=A0A840RKX5_9BURK|nr:hypothetical protein [Glaciimonas immobilis]KAF3998896.1 hypothetical protein HAV38_02740 [Glaciimonas immobilis]MBB5198295.1 hypothetical protein [Glaciimonas immobilis]